MPNNRHKPKPQSAEDRRAVRPEEGYTNSLPPARTDYSRREYQTRREGSPKPPFIGLQDIDEAIMYYFGQVIRPSVVQNAKKIAVPVMYGSPERWSNVQKDGALRDKNGKFLAPLIMIKRTNLSKNRSLSNKMDANYPSNFAVVKNKYTRENIYDNFSVLTNRRPKEEYYATIVPDFVTLTYTCAAFTDYVEQMNKIIEAANFAEDSYWGDPAKFMFRARIDTFGTTTEVQAGSDRIVTTTFDIILEGFVIPEVRQSEIQNFRKSFSKAQLFFNFEIAGTLEQLEARAAAAPVEPGVRFFDTGLSAGGSSQKGMTAEEIAYVTLNGSALADSTTNTTATFNSLEIVAPPAGFTSGATDFSLYVNGQFVPITQFSVAQVGSNVVATVDTSALGYILESSDEILLTGKIR